MWAHASGAALAPPRNTHTTRFPPRPPARPPPRQVRCLRPDRVIFCATSYVANSLGRKFVEPPVLDLGETLTDSSPVSPLIFVLSAGVDPSDNLRKLAQERGMAANYFSVALGQGQAPLATRWVAAAARARFVCIVSTPRERAS